MRSGKTQATITPCSCFSAVWEARITGWRNSSLACRYVSTAPSPAKSKKNSSPWKSSPVSPCLLHLFFQMSRVYSGLSSDAKVNTSNSMWSIEHKHWHFIYWKWCSTAVQGTFYLINPLCITPFLTQAWKLPTQNTMKFCFESITKSKLQMLKVKDFFLTVFEWIQIIVAVPGTWSHSQNSKNLLSNLMTKISPKTIIRYT